MAERAPYPIVGQGHGYASGTLGYYGIASLLTKEEHERAFANLSYLAETQRLPLLLLENWRSFEGAALLSSAVVGDTYDSVTTLTAGNEWDNGGDPLADLATLAQTLADQSGEETESVVIEMSRASWRALATNTSVKDQLTVDNTGLISLVPEQGAADRTLGRRRILASLLEVADVRIANPRGLLAEDGQPTDLLPDMAYAYLPESRVDEPSTERSRGSVRWAATFANNLGTAEPPWYEPSTREHLYPAIGEWNLRVVNSRAGAALFNTSAA